MLLDRVALYAWVVVAPIKKRMERGNWLAFSEWVLRETVADRQGRRGGGLGEKRGIGEGSGWGGLSSEGGRHRGPSSATG